MALEAKICCPHCKKLVTVRIKEALPPDAERMFEHADRMFSRMIARFDRMFGRG